MPTGDGPGHGGGAADRLSPLERRIMDIEGRWWRQAGSKEVVVREELGLSGVRYYQILNHLLDRPEALEYAPMTVNRLRALRDRARHRGRPLRDPGSP